MILADYTEFDLSTCMQKRKTTFFSFFRVEQVKEQQLRAAPEMLEAIISRHGCLEIARSPEDN
jgi:hypothetical protein